MEISDDWIAGFFDGDGTFKISKTQTSPGKTGTRYRVIVSQDKRSIQVLYAIKKRFQVGSVNRSGNDMRQYLTTNKEHILNVILPFFIKHPLRTQKLDDFKLLYDHLMQNYNGAKSSNLPQSSNQLNLSTEITRDWLLGFIDAEGNFHVSFVDGYPRPQFSIGLHERDLEILKQIKNFLGCGNIYKKTPQEGNPYYVYQISDLQGFKTIINTCTTSGNRCLLRTTKRFDFIIFRRIVRLIENGKHLTSEGKIAIDNILKRRRLCNEKI